MGFTLKKEAVRHKISLDLLATSLLNKGLLSDLRQFLTTEGPLKFMKNAFYFMLKAIFFLKIFTFLSSLFGHARIQLEKKMKTNFFLTSLHN